MFTMSRVAQTVVLFVAVAGFLFGQVFNGVFSLAGTLAGIGGLLAGGLMAFASRPGLRQLVLTGCGLGLVGAALHVYDYYSTPQLGGNYYPWFLTLPFALGLVFIASRSLRRPTAPEGSP